MQRLFIPQLIVGIILLILFSPALMHAESARQLVQSGNNAYQAGDYKKSLEDYDKAAAAEPDSPVILFNKCNTLYKQEAYDEAIKMYEQAAIQSIQRENQALEAKSRFNMGNNAFRQAEILRSTDLQTSLDIYEQSAENYQAALQISPELVDAGHNLEMARKAANQVLREIKKQEQLQQQQKQTQEQLSKELEELVQKQQDAAQKSSELTESQQQEATAENGQKSEKLAEKQQAIKNRTEELASKLEQLSEQQKGQPSGEKSREHLNRAVQEQQQAEEKLRSNTPERAKKNQEKAAAEMLQALNDIDQQQEQQEEQKSQQEQSSEQQDNSRQQTETAQTDNEKTEAEAHESQVAPSDQTAQEILNEETENRKIRQGRSITGYKSVEKDW